jgi:hypothetical protein
MKLGDRVRVDPYLPQFGGLTGSIVGHEPPETWHVKLDRAPSETRAWSEGYLIPLDAAKAVLLTPVTKRGRR